MHYLIILTAAILFTTNSRAMATDATNLIVPTDTTQQDAEAVKELIIEENRGNTDNLYNLLRDGDSLSPFRKSLQMPNNYSLDCSNLTLPFSGKVLSPFGFRGKRMHSGTDIKLLQGDSVATVAPGVIIFARYYGGYGNIIVVRHTKEFETFYSHLSSMLVKEGTVVNKGEIIGLGGRTGRATGTHLHFEVRIGGKALNSEIIFDFENKMVRATRFIFNPNGKGKLIASNNSFYYPLIQQIGPSMASHEPTKETTIVKKPEPTTHTKIENKSNNKQKTKSHTIKKGDTLYSIAKKYGITVNQIRKLNSIPNNGLIREGKILLLPSS